MTRNSWKAFIGLFILTMGTSTLTPLIPLYRTRFDLSNGTLTLLFSVYALTVVPTMLISGNLADRLGRKWMLLPAMAFMTIASAVFAFTASVPLLFAGRVLQGLAIGGFLGVGTAFIVDHARADRRPWAATMAGIAFRVGFGLGPGLAGLVAQNTRGEAAIHRPFQGHIALMFVAIVAIALAPETIARRPGGRFALRVGVPDGQMRAFATFLAPATFFMSFLEGTLLSVAPLFIAHSQGGHTNVAVVGLVGFLTLAMGGLAPLMISRLDPRRAVLCGVAISAIWSGLIPLAAWLDSVWLIVVAALAIGFTNGFILQGGTVICSTVVPIRERGKLLSALYMCAYSGTLPVIALGYISDAIGLPWALSIFCVLAVCLASFVLTVGRRNFRVVVPYNERAVQPVLVKV